MPICHRWRAQVRGLAAGLLICGLLAPAAAPAQGLPGSVEPGRLRERIQPPPGPAPTPEIIAPEIPEAVPPSEAAKIQFVLRRVVIDGMTVYTPDQLRPLYAELVGKTVSLLDVYHLADTITVKYRSDGYVLSRAVVPAQRIIDGVVQIRVVEGFVNRTIIEGKDDPAIRAYAEQITRSRPLKAADMERYLLLINDLPGVRARGVLSPATGVLGGSDLTIVVERQPVSATTSLDNRGSKFVGPLELFAEGQVNNGLGFSDSTLLRYLTVPGHAAELRYLEFGETVPLGSEGTKFSFSASRSDSEPASTLHTDILDTETKALTLFAKLNHPIVRSRTENLFIDTTLIYRNSTVDQFSLPSETRLTSSYDDRIRAIRAGISYDVEDGWEGRDFARFELSQGLPVFRASESGRLANTSRPGGLSHFTKATLDASRQQNLDSVTPGLGFLTGLSAEWSFNKPLLASEQFGVGGATFGRAYDPSEITGDYGVAVRAELEYGMDTVALGLGEQTRLQPYSFYDFGLVRDVNPVVLNEAERQRSIASAGFGVRFGWANHFATDLQVAKPLTRVVGAYSDSSDPNPWRAFFALVGTF